MIQHPFIAWFYEPGERFPRYVVVHSAKISSADLSRVQDLLEAGQATDDFTPIVFLDDTLNSEDLRERIQAEAIRREPPRREA